MIEIKVDKEKNSNEVNIQGTFGDVFNELCGGLAHAISLLFDDALGADLFLQFLGESEKLREEVEKLRKPEPDDE